MQVDITFYEQAALTILGAVMTVAVPWVSASIISHLKIASNSATATRVETGVNALAQLAAGDLAKTVAGHPTIDVKNAAVARAMTTTTATLKTAQDAMGISDEVLAQRVAGALAGMLPAPVAAPVVTVVPVGPAAQPTIGSSLSAVGIPAAPGTLQNLSDKGPTQ